MTHLPKLSVVMAVQDEQRYIRDALDSVLNQTFNDFEFIIIDDGSSDETGPILDDYARRDSRIHVVHQPNQGLIASLNHGLALARAPLIARMDGDDMSLPHRFERQMLHIEEHPDLAVLGAFMREIDEDDVEVGIARRPLRDEAIKAALQEYVAISHATVIMRKAAVQAVGGYRSAFIHAEDYDLWLRLADHHQFANLPQVLYVRRLHGRQVSIRYLRQQVLSVLAARRASEIRRATDSDPGDSMPPPTFESLLAMGVDSLTIRKALINAHLRLIHVALQRGDAEEAARWLEELEIERTGGGELHRPAEVWWMRSWLQLLRKQRMAAMRSAMHMMTADPAEVLRAAVRRVRRLARGRERRA